MLNIRTIERTVLTLFLSQLAVFSGLLHAQTDSDQSCETLSLYGSIEKFGKKFRSKGVGTAFELGSGAGSQKLILTPAHVIAYADKVLLQCGGQEAEAEILKFDLEADIAVLKAKSSEWARKLNPSFSLSGKGRPIEAEKNFGDPLSSDDLFYKFRRSNFSDEGVTETAGMVVPANGTLSPAMPDYVEFPNSYWPVHKSMIDLIGVGITPGMSGASVYGTAAMGQPSPFLGMTIKTEINGSRSLAIPAHSILRWLRSHLSSSTQRVVQSGLGYVIEYHFVQDGSRLNRHRSLKIANANGGVDEFFEECPSGAWFLNSSWLDVSGGSWGDGGGGYIHESYSGTGQAGVSLLGMFRNLEGCNKEGIKDSKGTRYVGAKINGSLYSVKQLEDLIALKKRTGHRTRLSQTLVTPQNIDFSDLCKGKTSVFPASTGMGYGRDVGPQSYSKGFSSSTYRSYRRSSPFQHKTLSCGSGGSFDVNLNFKKEPWIFRETDNENSGSNHSGADLQISGSLKITKSHIEGDLLLHGHPLKFRSPRQGTWTHSLRVSGGRLLIDFGTSERIFHVTFAPDKASNKLPWTISHSWLSKDAVR